MQGGVQPDDEGYVVPALLKFGGHPEVTLGVGRRRC